MVSGFCSCNILSRSLYFFSVILVTDLTNLKQIVLGKKKTRVGWSEKKKSLKKKKKKNRSWLVGEEEVTGKKKKKTRVCWSEKKSLEKKKFGKEGKKKNFGKKKKRPSYIPLRYRRENRKKKKKKVTKTLVSILVFEKLKIFFFGSLTEKKNIFDFGFREETKKKNKNKKKIRKTCFWFLEN